MCQRVDAVRPEGTARQSRAALEGQVLMAPAAIAVRNMARLPGCKKYRQSQNFQVPSRLLCRLGRIQGMVAAFDLFLVFDKAGKVVNSLILRRRQASMGMTTTVPGGCCDCISWKAVLQVERRAIHNGAFSIR